MKTPWSKLLQYGTGVAALIVIAVAGIVMMATVAIAIVLTKILVIIR